MKYNDKYLRVNEKWENGGMFRGKEECLCASCSEPTLWIEPSFKVHICSDECYSELCKEVHQAMQMGMKIIMD